MMLTELLPVYRRPDQRQTVKSSLTKGLASGREQLNINLTKFTEFILFIFQVLFSFVFKRMFVKTFTWQKDAPELYTVFMLVFFFLQLVMSLCLVFGRQQLQNWDAPRFI